ncbi:MAG TPA: MGMT family protein, partial [Myxococcota bacterium]|nr:MGMT family protein [Myxococcota bacterium]
MIGVIGVAIVPSPIGPLHIVADEAITGLRFGDGPPATAPTPLLREAAAQLAAWLDGRLFTFDLPLAPSGTPFQRAVWEALRAIPYGATTSYGALAQA